MRKIKFLKETWKR